MLAAGIGPTYAQLLQNKGISSEEQLRLMYHQKAMGNQEEQFFQYLKEMGIRKNYTRKILDYLQVGVTRALCLYRHIIAFFWSLSKLLHAQDPGLPPGRHCSGVMLQQSHQFFLFGGRPAGYLARPFVELTAS